MRLQPLTSSAMPSIRDMLAMSEEAEKAELRKARKTLARDVASSSANPASEEDHEAIAEHGKNKKDGLKPLKTSQTYPPLSSAFILFNRQIAAHLAVQALAHHAPYRMAGKYTEISPEDVIWCNLGLNPYEMKVRQTVSWGLTLGLVILWAFPGTFFVSLFPVF